MEWNGQPWILEQPYSKGIGLSSRTVSRNHSLDSLDLPGVRLCPGTRKEIVSCDVGSRVSGDECDLGAEEETFKPRVFHTVFLRSLRKEYGGAKSVQISLFRITVGGIVLAQQAIVDVYRSDEIAESRLLWTFQALSSYGVLDISHRQLLCCT